MHTTSRRPRSHRLAQSAWIAALALTSLAASRAVAAAGNAAAFSKPVIDIGIVVQEADKAAAFYTNAIGFTEVQGFSVTGELGKKVGLIDNHPVTVRVFVLGDGDLATRIKLLAFPGVTGKPAPRPFIHTAPGIQYLTLYVTSADQALARLKQAGVQPIGETPVTIGPNTRLITVRDPDGNFIELIGP